MLPASLAYTRNFINKKNQWFLRQHNGSTIQFVVEAGHRPGYGELTRLDVAPRMPLQVDMLLDPNIVVRLI